MAAPGKSTQKSGNGCFQVRVLKEVALKVGDKVAATRRALSQVKNKGKIQNFTHAHGLRLLGNFLARPSPLRPLKTHFMKPGDDTTRIPATYVGKITASPGTAMLHVETGHALSLPPLRE